MKQNSLLQYIILYVIVACVALAIAALARMFAVSVGFDSFTTFIVFIVALAVQVVVYLSIRGTAKYDAALDWRMAIQTAIFPKED